MPESLCCTQGLPTVAGRLEISLAAHERRLLVLIEEEQRKVSPDNALVAALCDAVRVVREYSDSFEDRGISCGGC